MHQHFRTLLTVLDALSPDNGVPLPRRPLVVDVACGPGTATLGLAEWLARREGGAVSFSCVGIDASSELLLIADQFLSDPALFGPAPRHLFFTSVNQISAADIVSAAHGCDGVVYLLSYLLHQPSIMSMLRHIFSLVVSQTMMPDTWLVLQDANYPDKPAAGIDIWPNSRVNQLSSFTESLGYDIDSWGCLLPSVHAFVSLNWDVEESPGAPRGVYALFQRIR